MYRVSMWATLMREMNRHFSVFLRSSEEMAGLQDYVYLNCEAGYDFWHNLHLGVHRPSVHLPQKQNSAKKEITYIFLHKTSNNSSCRLIDTVPAWPTYLAVEYHTQIDTINR